MLLLDILWQLHGPSYLFGKGSGGGVGTVALPSGTAQEYRLWIGQESDLGDGLGTIDPDFGHRGNAGSDSSLFDTMRAALTVSVYDKVLTDPTATGEPADKLDTALTNYENTIVGYDRLVEWADSWSKVSTDLLAAGTGVLDRHNLDIDHDGIATLARTAGNYHQAVKDMVNEAVLQVDQCGVLRDVDLSALVQAAENQIPTLIEEAIESAVSAIDESVIADAVTAFGDSTKTQKALEVRRFAGHMADINAVHGSAFLIGMALINRQHLEDQNKFNAELRHRTYDQAFAAHIDVFKANLQAQLSAAIQNMVQRLEFVKQNIQLMLTAYRDEILNYVREYLGNWDFEQAVFRESSNQTFGQAIQYLAHHQQLASMTSQLQGAKYVMSREYVTTENDRTHDQAMHGLEVWQAGAVVLGIPTGMTSTIPKGPTAAQSALSGAASGAGTGFMLGSAVPGIGTAVGTAVGAGIGGLLGLASAG